MISAEQLKSLDLKSLRNTPLGYTEQLAYIKSIDMLNKNTQGAKKGGQVGSTS